MTDPYYYTPPPEWLVDSQLIWERTPGGETLGEAWRRILGEERDTSWIHRYDGGEFFAHLYHEGWVSVNSFDRQEIRKVRTIPHVDDLVEHINLRVAPREEEHDEQSTRRFPSQCPQRAQVQGV